MSDTSMPAGQGRLAQVIAARGGLAPPEEPFVIEHREALIYMLCEAAELEHAIMCQYLFAAFSLKKRAGEGLSDVEVEAVGRWRKKISHVATQEMLHLALVHNVLSAVGAAPHLGRPNLPQPANHYPAGVQLALLPFGERALRHFMFLERPEGMDLNDAEGLAAAGRAEPLLEAADIVPRLQDFATVGHLYRSIEEGLSRLAEKYGEAGLFVGPPEAQASSADFRWPELVAVTDLASARRALDEILDQGEGPRGAWQAAHFGQFVDILDEYLQLTEANSNFDPVRPVLVANCRPGEHTTGVPLIGDPMTARCTDLFNVGYEILLQALERYFAHTEETDAQLSTLADLTIGIMFRVIRPLGDLITTLPVGPDHPGMTAGPSFELFYESDYLMPHRGAAWALLEERLHEAADLAEGIRTDADPQIVEALAPIAPAFVDLAESLAAHVGEWGAVSRWATPPAPQDPSPLAERDGLVARARPAPEAISRAAELADTVARAVPGDAMAGLFAQAHRLVEAEAPAGPDAAVAGVLVNSVLRPLADAIAAADGTAFGQAPPPSGPIREATLAESLWGLATAATALRVEPAAPSGLVEATAALQRLVAEVDPGDAAVRLAELGGLQAGLPAGIEVATDGPYLVTNPANVYDWLGQRISARPQMALCRCGASEIKPYCDGSHATTGFSGAKDPDRVVDRRDTYVGEVTIFDNRGLCQHSGRCTDRVATAFRTATEPFVAPSGGRMDELIRAVQDCPSGALGFALADREIRELVDTDREAAIEVGCGSPQGSCDQGFSVLGDGLKRP